MICEFCKIDTTNPRFCSRSCAAKVNNSKRKNRNICICGKECSDRHTSFCSRNCYFNSIYPNKIAEWKQTGTLNTKSETISILIKRYLRERSGNKCEVLGCGWNKVHPITGIIPLQVDHIDGNFNNNKEENLRLICPNCHSLTSTFGALNKGNGRKIRKQKRNASVV